MSPIGLDGVGLTRRRSHLRRLHVLGLATLGMVAAAASPALFRAAAELRPSDVVVVLAGDHERVSYARSLVETGVAPRLLTTLVDPACTGAGHALGMCASGVQNTVDEALFVHRVLTAEGVRRATVVTSGYHAVRAAAVFRAAFIGSGIEITVVAPPGSWWSIGPRTSELWKLFPSVGAVLVGRLCDCLYTQPSLR